MKRLFLLDAYALIFRGYYAFIKNPRINSKGLNTSAIFGFTNSLLELINKEKPTHLAVVFDVGGDTFRHEEFSDYKANRDETPEPIKVAVPYIHSILEALHIPIIGLEGYEADDIIGTLAKKAEQSGYEVFMVTPDKDFGQLVSEHIKIYKPAGRFSDLEILGRKEILEKYGFIHPQQVIDLLGLMGDAVDNIPGVPGVGEKTALKLIHEFGSVENLIENTDKLSGKLKENLEKFSEQALLSKRLATIKCDVPIEFNEQQFTLDPPDVEKITEIFNELEFRRLLETFKKAYQNHTEAALAKTSKKEENTEQLSMFGAWDDSKINEQSNGHTNIHTRAHFYQLVSSLNELKLLIKTLQNFDIISFDTETNSLDEISAHLVGIAISHKSGKGYYIKLPESFEEQKPWMDEILHLLKNEKVLKIGHNLKYDIKVLHKYGIEEIYPFFDTMLAHYLLFPNSRHGLDDVALQLLKYEMIPIEKLIGQKGKNQQSFSMVDVQTQKEYAVEDADITLQLYHILQPKLHEFELSKVFEEIELPLLLVLADMEYTGVALDIGYLKELSQALENDLNQLEQEITTIAGAKFNLNSPKQLGEILFEKLSIDPKAKKTKTGQYATSEDILQKLKHKHPVVEKILEYRQYQKLKSTYTDALPKEVHPQTGRVHTSFAQAVASTGRLASNKPNLQNIPIKTERGRAIRKAFIASPGNKMIAADYSQIELRILASMSQDSEMMKAFQNNEDIHASTAAKIFKVPIQKVTREQRAQAKTVNFGIVYGVSAFGLSEQTGLSKSEAKQLIDAYYETYPRLRSFMDEQIAFARKHGFVSTLLGRKRDLPEIHSSNAVLRGHAERNAINAPIQGTAADIIKLAMIDLWKKLKELKSGAKLLLQVHDELVLECPENELDEVKVLVKETMENAFKLNVPLVADVGVGDNWLEAH